MKKLTLCILILAGTTSAIAQTAPEIIHREVPVTHSNGPAGPIVFRQSTDPIPLAIDKNAQAVEFVLYPSPASSILNIRMDAKGEPLTANILDMSGRVVLTQELIPIGVNTIDISSLHAGMYTCQIVANDAAVQSLSKHVSMKRFIVK